MHDALFLCPEMKSRWRLPEGEVKFGWKDLVHKCTPEQLVTQYPNDWPTDDLLRNLAALVTGSVLWLSGMLFPTVHGNAKFPSTTEDILGLAYVHVYFTSCWK